LHDIGPAGEQIHRIPVAPYILSIELRAEDDPRLLTALFTVRSGVASTVQPTADDDAPTPQSEHPPTDPTHGAAPATKPPPPGLFVAVSGRSPP